MADVRSELAQLRPVYETGVLRMLLHKYSDIYIAMLRACFDPLTAEVPQERLLARMREAIGELAADGTYTPREGEDAVSYTHLDVYKRQVHIPFGAHNGE